jgi:hypothetical protein
MVVVNVVPATGMESITSKKKAGSTHSAFPEIASERLSLPTATGTSLILEKQPPQFQCDLDRIKPVALKSRLILINSRMEQHVCSKGVV